MTIHKATSTSVCLLVVLLINVFNAVAAANDPGQPASIIRVAPPPPVFDQKTRHTELRARRTRVAQAIGPNGLLVLFGAESKVYTGDVDYEYRQENNLHYLTNLKQKGARLVLLPGNNTLTEILFIPRRIPELETWNGRMYSAEEANQVSGIEEIWETSEFEPFIQALRNRQPYRPKPEKVLRSTKQVDNTSAFDQLFEAAAKGEALLYVLGMISIESKEYRQEQRFIAEWMKGPAGFTLRSAFPIFVALRQRKSPMEIALLQHAIDITSEAHQRAWAAAGDAAWEYQVDALVAYTYKLRNSRWGFPSIIGCGPNATTLHYDASQGECKAGDLLLMDVGAEYEHYSADVTRTVPVSGEFSPAQADVYQVVFNAQEAAGKAIRPGVLISDVERAATTVIKDGLLKLGLITDLNSNQFRIWFMHGTCHWLGMNVHDVGNFGARLEPGMVFTNEPGIYVRADALDYKPFGMTDTEWEKFKTAVRPAFEKYKGIGVRIEDDMLVTTDGVKWMTGALPRTIADIESFIAKARSAK